MVFSGLVWFWLDFFLVFSDLSLIWFFQFHAYKTKTKPNQIKPVNVFKILISLINFFKY